MTTARKTSVTARPPRQRAASKTVVRKAAGKPAAKAPLATPVARALPDQSAAAAAKGDKPKKHKLVRDSFTIPKAEYMVLQDLKLRAAMSGAATKKSEILRAGITALAAMNDAAFSAALRAVPALKTGRPAKDKV
jgi:hypothetical protein